MESKSSADQTPSESNHSLALQFEHFFFFLRVTVTAFDGKKTQNLTQIILLILTNNNEDEGTVMV